MAQGGTFFAHVPGGDFDERLERVDHQVQSTSRADTGDGAVLVSSRIVHGGARCAPKWCNSLHRDYARRSCGEVRYHH